MLGPYAGTTVVDDYTAEVNFNEPNAGFVNAMANAVGEMNSPTRPEGRRVARRLRSQAGRRRAVQDR